MDTPEIRRMYGEMLKLRSRYTSKLKRDASSLSKELDVFRSSTPSKKIPIVDEPERAPDRCFRDYLIAEVIWLQNDMALEKKWKHSQAKKLSKDSLRHRYIQDRQAGVDLVEQNLRKVSATLCVEVEKFWKGVRQLAHHRFGKLETQLKREEHQKRLDELVDRTEQYIKGDRKRSRSETLDEVEDLLADADKPLEAVASELSYVEPEPMEMDRSSKTALLDQISREMTAAAPTGNSFSTTRVSIPVPSLIRASLREYQHIGLEWLAALHERGLNGILADEMGLGKTLQTIALLAHLAVDKGIWGPHLIVVPTSVMINWEIEFKKFLPGFKVMVYFGSPKERRAKRVGWRNEEDLVFNVCICSYALVLQDAPMFRKKNWYYLILDEAHQIKNFKSLRWQNLLTFKTERRLLLTGTPLQNDLIELWSLLHFLMPHIFTSHVDFQEWFSDPLNKAIEHSKLDEHSKLINRLHALIRPFLLRRLKKDVETQMPSKYEHVLPVPLSRRQQVLYDEFLSHRETRQTVKIKNDYLGLMNVLMQLRKVCNHPDLLEPRPVRSPYVQTLHDIEFPRPLSAQSCQLLRQWDTERELSTRRPFWYVDLERGKYESKRSIELERLTGEKERTKDNRSLLNQFIILEKTRVKESEYLENDYVRMRWECTQKLRFSTPATHREVTDPFIGKDGVRIALSIGGLDTRMQQLKAWELVESEETRLNRLWRGLSQYMAYTPPVIVSPWEEGRNKHRVPSVLHRPWLDRLCRLPDRRFLEWDCGKFRTLRMLLTKLRSDNHKVIMFTQMSKMLDVIEAFANLCGFTYVRLDGGTKVTERQLVVDRFNRDKKIFLFISSTRAGGVGINLTGADTVVFFDSDWNPAMDRQAMDRCHRIGQIRDVHIYRLVSEKTIEENIFVKQLQKRQLDHVVIDQATGGEAPKFVQSTGLEHLLDGVIMDDQLTEPSQRSSIYGTHILWERPGDDEIAVEKTKTKADLEMERMLAKVEDSEDVSALKTAMKEREVVALNDQAVDVEQTEGKLPVEALHANNEDPQYLQLPGIVRRSVDLLESLLVEERKTSTPELENDEEEWEELDQAKWASDDEQSYSD